MEFERNPYDQNAESDDDFHSLDYIIGDLAVGKQVRIFVDGIPGSEDRSLIDDLREAGAEVIVPADN